MKCELHDHSCSVFCRFFWNSSRLCSSFWISFSRLCSSCALTTIFGRVQCESILFLAWVWRVRLMTCVRARISDFLIFCPITCLGMF